MEYSAAAERVNDCFIPSAKSTLVSGFLRFGWIILL